MVDKIDMVEIYARRYNSRRDDVVLVEIVKEMLLDLSRDVAAVAATGDENIFAVFDRADTNWRRFVRLVHSEKEDPVFALSDEGMADLIVKHFPFGGAVWVASRKARLAAFMDIVAAAERGKKY